MQGTRLNATWPCQAMHDAHGVFAQDLQRLLAEGPSARPATARPGAR